MERIYRISSVSLRILFYLLLGLIPLIMFTKSTEIFELNKTVFLYVATILVSLVWITKSVSSRKPIFRYSILTFPILLFLFVNLVSAYLSIDVYTSIFGYYGRFNGGILTLICFSLLYFAYVSNMGRRESHRSITLIIFSSIAVGIYAVSQRFGIDDHLWAQDVMYRVFSTFGQPNWLSSWIAMITPLAIATYFGQTESRVKRYILIFLPSLYLLTIILSKSRSGLIGFTVSFLFMFIYIVKIRKTGVVRNLLTKYFVLTLVSMFLIFLFAGTPWSPSLSEFDTNHPVSEQIYDRRGDNTILTRKYVWIAAINSWKDHPVFGTGPETFAYVFPKYKPVEHNNTVEWSHIFNKVHNEYLNYLSNTGIVGLVGYLVLVIASIYSFYDVHKSLKDKGQTVDKITNFALFSGFISVLGTNFVGFSTITTNLLAFLFPAISLTLSKEVVIVKVNKSSVWQHLLIGISVVGSIVLIFAISRFWLSDYYIAKAESFTSKGKYNESIYYTNLALTLSDNSIVKSKASSVYLDYALSKYFEEPEEFHRYLDTSLSLSDEAISNSPANIILKIDKANLYLKLSAVDFKYLEDARVLLTSTISESPNDPKLWYNLGLVYAKQTDNLNALKAFEKSSMLKPDYKTPRLGILLICQKNKDNDCMKSQSDYILNFIDSEDELANSVRSRLQE